ncbi:MAG: PQQ-binding-like beta-propeller repeat protein, partial [Phycisphaerales bacterium]|nr:PQQ-binding-like beta-propeller repeat protein [Phycisphaerales bacterium]
MIWRDFVITTRPSAADIVNQTQVFAYDLDTGALRWTVTLPKSFANSWYTRVEAVDRGVAYVTRCGNGQPEYLYAIDVMTGALRWQSPMTINSNSTEQAAIAPDGDLLTTLDNTHIVRIDAVTGQPVWTTPRTCPSSEGCALAIHGDRVYGWQNQVGGTSVVAYDLATGAFRYSIPLSATQGVQQTQLMVGPDGTIYAPRSVSTT